MEAVKRSVETGKRGCPTVAQEILVVIRYRDNAVVKTDYYLSNAGKETPLAEFCRAAKAEHRIEECLQRAKGEAGLADYEVRNWKGWQQHQTLSLLASWDGVNGFASPDTRHSSTQKNTNCPCVAQLVLSGGGGCPVLPTFFDILDARKSLFTRQLDSYRNMWRFDSLVRESDCESDYLSDCAEHH